MCGRILPSQLSLSHPRNTDLTRRDADLAVRFARPTAGGLSIVGQKLARLSFAAFGAAHLSGQDPGPWIMYGDSVASLPQARWIARAQASENRSPAPLKVVDAETALEAAALGLGKVLLPEKIGVQDPRLQQIGAASLPGGMPQRDVWLLSHSDQVERRGVERVKTWIRDLAW